MNLLRWLNRGLGARFEAIRYSRPIIMHPPQSRVLPLVPRDTRPGMQIHWSPFIVSAESNIQDGELYEEVEFELPAHCSGCGVRLQQENPNGPGYFQVPKRVIEELSDPHCSTPIAIEDEIDLKDDVEMGDLSNQYNKIQDDRDMDQVKSGDGWVHFDNLVESWIDDDVFDDNGDGNGQRRGGRTQKRRQPVAQPVSYEDREAETDILARILCSRCYSLSHYGRVKSEAAEESLPSFDFGKVIGTKLNMQKFIRSIVLMVVDLGDFDGSLPRAAIKSLLPSGFRGGDENAAKNLPFRLIVAANKADLLPSVATYSRIENWVRRRMAQGGLPRPAAVHIVSSHRGSGIKNLLADLQAGVGNRGNVWVVGAQNAGKSSLINAMRSSVGLSQERKVTVAPVPGTTLGIVPVPSLLPRGCKMYDTPGVPHDYQLAAYMTSDEMKMLLPKRPLKPRTYRIGAGQSVSIGGVARFDVEQVPGATLYLTVWVSDEIGCHMGKIEGAEERYARHAGTKLSPPVGDEKRMESFPKLISTDIEVRGDSWRESSIDVAVAGLGWVSVGVDGDAKLKIWAPPGVAITIRDAMLPDYAKELERPGFGYVSGSGSKVNRSAGKDGRKRK